MNFFEVSDINYQNIQSEKIVDDDNSHCTDILNDDTKLEDRHVEKKQKHGKSDKKEKISKNRKEQIKLPGSWEESDQVLTNLTSVDFTRSITPKIAAQKFPCFFPKSKNKVKYFFHTTFSFNNNCNFRLLNNP